jgi:para-nitrobenzyl esterase
VQSGPPSATPLARAADATAKLLAEFGVTAPGQLRDVPVDRLVDAQARVLTARAGGGLVLTPVVDGTSLPAAPDRAIADGASAGIPLVIGTNRDEAKMFMVADPKNRDPDEDVLLSRIERGFAASGVKLGAGEVIDAYRQARAAAGISTEPREIWSAIESDRMFRLGSVRAAEAHAAHQPATYMYLFTWESPAMQGALGACHALELPFVFGTLDAPGMDRFAGSGPAAQRLSDAMMDAWIEFARTGSPGPDWPAYDPSRRATRIFDADVRTENAPMDRERQVWDPAAQ